MKKQKLSQLQIGALADAFKRSPITIRRWEKNNDDRLFSDKARAALSIVTTSKKRLDSL